MLAFTARSNEYMPCCWPTTQCSGKLCVISCVSLRLSTIFLEAPEQTRPFCRTSASVNIGFSVCRMCESALAAFIAQKDKQEAVEGEKEGR